MNRVCSFVVVLVLVLSGLVFVPLGLVSADGFGGRFAGGSGTVGDPYRISNVFELQNVSLNLTQHFILINDINASVTSGWNGGDGFVPIGDSTTQFTGTFDGQNYTISNLYINRSATDFVGLFGYMDSGSVENVRLVDVDIVGNLYVGGLVGANWYGSVSNCSVTGSISGDTRVGGIVGQSDGLEEYCISLADISGSGNRIGGLVGHNAGTVSNCYAMGNITGPWGLGGLVGANSGSVSNSYATGNIAGSTWHVGGLAGGNTGTISDSFWDNQTSGQTTSDGGTPKTTAEMQTLSTFNDSATDGLTTPWDIALIEDHTTETWYIDEHNDYPRLGWEFVPPPLVINLDTLKGFQLIQEAIDDVDTLDGHTLFILNSVVHHDDPGSSIFVNKSLTLMGEDGAIVSQGCPLMVPYLVKPVFFVNKSVSFINLTINSVPPSGLIEEGDPGSHCVIWFADVVDVVFDNVTISGGSHEGVGSDDTVGSVYIYNSTITDRFRVDYSDIYINNSVIDDIQVNNCRNVSVFNSIMGVFIPQGSGFLLMDNVTVNGGFSSYTSLNGLVTNSTFNDWWGVCCVDYFDMVNCSFTTALWVWDTSMFNMSYSTFTNAEVYYDDVYGGYVFHNNFIATTFFVNEWGGVVADINHNLPYYSFGGNYYSDYAGVDLFAGSDQDMPFVDGIGDTSHAVGGGVVDVYPWMIESGWESIVFVEVNVSGVDSHFDDVQSGFDIISENGVVLVYEGVYEDNFVLDVFNVSVIGFGSVVFDGLDMGHVLVVESDNCSFSNIDFVGMGGNTGVLVRGDNFTLFECSVVGGGVGNGVYLFGVSGCVLTNSSFSGLEYGVYVFNSNNNMIYHNEFRSNVFHAWDNGNNVYNVSMSLGGGNYWDTHTSPDNNFDGFVDVPFSIPGGGNSDFLPWSDFPFGVVFTSEIIFVRQLAYFIGILLGVLFVVALWSRIKKYVEDNIRGVF